MAQMIGVAAGLILLLVWVVRRSSEGWRGLRVGRRPARRLELVEKLPLTAHHSLHAVRMDGRVLLIGVSPAGCNLLETGRAEAGNGAAC
jgi:flagellar biogenesis protein FliO